MQSLKKHSLGRPARKCFTAVWVGGGDAAPVLVLSLQCCFRAAFEGWSSGRHGREGTGFFLAPALSAIAGKAWARLCSQVLGDSLSDPSGTANGSGSI